MWAVCRTVLGLAVHLLGEAGTVSVLLPRICGSAGLPSTALFLWPCCPGCRAAWSKAESVVELGLSAAALSTILLCCLSHLPAGWHGMARVLGTHR